MFQSSSSQPSSGRGVMLSFSGSGPREEESLAAATSSSSAIIAAASQLQQRAAAAAAMAGRSDDSAAEGSILYAPDANRSSGGSDDPNNNNSSSSSDDDDQGVYSASGAANLLLKLIFHACVILQVVLWPSVMTITFVSALALEGLLTVGCSAARTLPKSLTEYSVLLMHGRKVTLGKYLLACIIAAYMLFFFTLFVAHEGRVQPAQTTWMHPDVMSQYKFDDEANTPFPNVDVGGATSKFMRNHPFVWPRSLMRNAVRVNGTIADGAGGAGQALTCAMSGAFACFSARMAAFDPPAPLAARRRFVPMLGQFYTADVVITPPAGTACSALEVYRLNVDDRKNVEHGLDYPGYTATTTTTTTPTTTTTTTTDATTPTMMSRRCALFGVAGLCLQFQHPFTPAQYAAQVAAKCLLGEGRLTIRLPVRALDVHPFTGRMGNDILLVTPGARVEMRWDWHDAGVRPPLLESWQQTPSAFGDQAQTWRDSSDSSAVFFKYAVAVTPLLILWYYLAVTFGSLVMEYQVLMTCLFVLMPSALFFLTVGAWLPMAGCIVCVIAINHTPAINNNLGGGGGGGGDGGGGGGATSSTATTTSTDAGWGPMIRHVLLFLTAVCNSIQFVWILVLIQQAEWSAFLYDGSLKQLADMSSQFIVSGSPMWIGLLLPVVLMVNFAFLLGSAICVAMEVLSTYTTNAAAPSSASSSSSAYA